MLKNNFFVGMLVRWYGRVKNIFQICVYVIILYREGVRGRFSQNEKDISEDMSF